MSTYALRSVRPTTPEKKLRAAGRLYVSARQIEAAALRALHPDWNEEDIARPERNASLYGRDSL